MAVTLDAEYESTGNIASGNNNEITNVVIASDHTMVIVICGGYPDSGSGVSLDVSNWDDHTTNMDFQTIHEQVGNGSKDSVNAYYMDSADGNWPGTGTKTFYFQWTGTGCYSGAYTVLYTVKGSATGAGAIIGSDGAYPGSAWTATSVGTVAAGDLGISGAATFNGSPILDVNNNGETEEFNKNSASCNLAVGSEDGEDQMTVASSSYAYVGALAFAIAAAAGGATVTPGKGTLSITGKALFANNTLTPANGALVLTGKNLQAYLDKTETIGAGSLSISGKNLTSLLGVTITPSTGSLTLTGNALGLTAYRVIAKVALALTGKNFNILTGTTVTPTTGSLSLTGKQLALVFTRVFAKGTLSLTGKNLQSFLNKYITPATGALTLTGKGLTALIGVTQTIVKGALTLTGKVIYNSMNIVIAKGALTLATKVLKVIGAVVDVARGLSRTGTSNRME